MHLEVNFESHQPLMFHTMVTAFLIRQLKQKIQKREDICIPSKSCFHFILINAHYFHLIEEETDHYLEHTSTEQFPISVSTLKWDKNLRIFVKKS